MRSVTTAVLGAAALMATASAALSETRTYEVKSFDALKIQNGLVAEIAVGGDQWITATSTDDDLLDKLDIDVRGDELQISIDRNLLDFLFDGGIGEWFGKRAGITLVISVPSLTSAEAHSGADLRITAMSGDALSVEASSGARIEAETAGDFIAVDGDSGAQVALTGACLQLQADVASGASLDLRNLSCDRVSVEASSGAWAGVNVNREIDADASSGGQIDVTGRPEDIEVDTSSGGDVDFNT